MIDVWRVPIMGFTQDSGRESGTEKLWRKLRNVSKVVSPSSSLIHPQEWDSKWDDLAEFMWRNSPPFNPPRIDIYAYSWGAGHGFIRLTKALHKRGMVVNNAVLCDPVYHHWLRPWRGLFHATLNPPIVVPENVMDVYGFFQRQDTPQGASLQFKSDNTRLVFNKRLSYSHAYMDDAKEYHEQVLDLAKESEQ